MPNQQTDLLIIGAGPFGLAIAAQAAHLGIDSRQKVASQRRRFKE